jgi:hypothetical protein
MEGVSTPEKAFIRGVRGCMEIPNHSKKVVSPRGSNEIRGFRRVVVPAAQGRGSNPEEAITSLKTVTGADFFWSRL